MPWVRFVSDFDWVPPLAPMTAVAFKRGMNLFVPTPCAQEAIATGKAEPSERPNDATRQRR